MTPPDATDSCAFSEARLPRPAPLKGRGTSWAIVSHLDRQSAEAFDDGWGTLDQQASEQTLPPATEIIEERAKSILAGNDPPDIPFELSINPYRWTAASDWLQSLTQKAVI